jgi:hypothetical protein
MCADVFSCFKKPDSIKCPNANNQKAQKWAVIWSFFGIFRCFLFQKRCTQNALKVKTPKFNWTKHFKQQSFIASKNRPLIDHFWTKFPKPTQINHPKLRGSIKTAVKCRFLLNNQTWCLWVKFNKRVTLGFESKMKGYIILIFPICQVKRRKNHEENV